MRVYSENRYNPNPISKFIATAILGYVVLHRLSIWFEFAAVVLISCFFFINDCRRQSIKTIVIYIFLFYLPNLRGVEHLNVFLKMFVSMLIVVRMFYLPFIAAIFMIRTSDVGSIISSMDKLKIPKHISIPVAVMFRFFPSFKEERANIRLAMRIRGISKKNPVAYLEYVMVPALIISSNISDDIAKAAETKCIENPIEKTRYIPVKIKPVDYAYVLTVLMIVAGGTLC